MIRAFILSIAIVGLFAGCGRVDDAVQDGSTIDQPSVPAANCIGLNVNSYGCYGEESVFNGKKIVQGVWSVYTQSNVENIGNVIFYDRYKRGLDFRSDGSVFMREKTDDFQYFLEWGVNDDGTKLTLSDGTTYTYQAVFSNDADCFKVLRSDGLAVKLCTESFVAYDGKNSSGYYGSNVTFGNLTHYYFNAVGSWRIAPYDSTNSASATTVTLDANGSTSTGGEWGVSADGKVMGIDGIRYLVYQFLKSPEDNCIAVFELSGGQITQTTWKLCKQ